MSWYLKCWINYFNFSGRARRTEFWMFALCNFLIALLLEGVGLVGKSGGIVMLYPLYQLAVIIPSLAVSVRRLHDTGRSGLWILILLIPLIGPILYFVWMCSDSQPGPNQYGLNPKNEGNND